MYGSSNTVYFGQITFISVNKKLNGKYFLSNVFMGMIYNLDLSIEFFQLTFQFKHSTYDKQVTIL